jgi:hypothetical protein
MTAPFVRWKHRAAGPRKGNGAVVVAAVEVRETPKKRRDDGTVEAEYQPLPVSMADFDEDGRLMMLIAEDG